MATSWKTRIRCTFPNWRVVVNTSPGGKISLHSRPVVMLSFAANYAISGLRPWPFHLTNLVIHIFAGLLLFGIVRRTLRLESMARFAETATPLGLVVAIVWTLHPLQTQAVTYVVQRYESLMGMFYLGAMYAFIRAVDTPAQATGWFTACVASCALAMGCKEVAVSCPLMILLYDRTFVSGSFARRGSGGVAGISRWPLAGRCFSVCTSARREAAGSGLASDSSGLQPGNMRVANRA